MKPVVFKPIYQDYVWGGGRIPFRFQRAGTPEPCAESWEIADRPEANSCVQEGPEQGKTLSQLVEAHGEALLGAGRAGGRFPLLVKILDAKTALSIQVHPSDETAPQCRGEAKTECWVALEGGPVYVGFKRPVSTALFVQAVEKGGVVDLLRKIDVKAGQMVYIPGGRIHAVGAGCLLLEVQQNSNTTYRVYDWGRPRPLHLAESLQCIQFDDDADPIETPQRVEAKNGVERWQLLSKPFFSLERWRVPAGHVFQADKRTFQIFFDPEKGKTVLLPAVSEPLIVQQPSEWLRIFIESRE